MSEQISLWVSTKVGALKGSILVSLLYYDVMVLPIFSIVHKMNTTIISLTMFQPAKLTSVGNRQLPRLLRRQNVHFSYLPQQNFCQGHHFEAKHSYLC